MLIQQIDGIALLRIFCGAWFIPHIYSKITKFGDATDFFSKLGCRPAAMFVIMTVLLELVATTGLIFDIYPVLAAGCGVAVLLGAGAAMVKLSGLAWRWQNLGLEYVLFWSFACVASIWDQL